MPDYEPLPKVNTPSRALWDAWEQKLDALGIYVTVRARLRLSVAGREQILRTVCNGQEES